MSANKKNKTNQPEGMGLDDRSSARRVTRSKRTTEQKPKADTSGINDVAKGAKKTSDGITQTSQGAARVAGGDITGAKDAVQGLSNTTKGAQEMNQGVDQLKESADEMDSFNPDKLNLDDDPNHSDDGGINKKKDLSDNPKNSKNKDSMFDDEGDSSSKDETDKDDSLHNDLDDMGLDGKKKGMKDLLDDSGDNNSDGDDKLSLKDDDDDDTLDFKDVKRGAKTAVTSSQAAIGASAMKSMMLMIQWLKGLAMQAAALASTIWTSIAAFAQAAVTFVANVTGISFVMSAITTAGTVILAGATVVASVITVAETNTDEEMKSDPLVCVPTTSSVKDSVSEWEDGGETSALRYESVNKAWSVFSEMGIDKKVAAGILGNFSAESGVDPTGVETIYSEPYRIGERKQHAMDVGFDVMQIDASYGIANTGVKLVGIGLGQWSNGRNTVLTTYAEDRGLDWYDIGTQLAFMFDGDNQSSVDILWDIANQDGITIDEATERFVREWEIPAVVNLEPRVAAASKIALDIETMTVDTDYAQSIISQMNVDKAEGNHHRSSYLQDDGCGDEVRSHYSGLADGTGVFPDVEGHMWAPKDLPSEVEPFTYDPKDAGMEYASSGGWIVNNNPGQCVAFSDSYMENLYPPLKRPGGVNGGDSAKAWYEKHHKEYGGELNKTPQAGAIFSHENSGIYGHTGVVQHVFANGDILVAEQNINGISGDNNKTPYTWGWRYFSVSDYRDDAGYSHDWVFWKPDLEPQWKK